MLALRRVTLMDAMDTVDCVANPVAMAEAIVPHPKKPIRRGASGSVHAVVDDDDKEVLELAAAAAAAWGAMLLLLLMNVVEEEVVAKAKVQDRNNGKSKNVDSKEKGRSILQLAYSRLGLERLG